MSDVVVNVVESATNVTVTEQDVAVDVTETVVEVSAATVGLQGIPGVNGVVAVTAPITNSGTSGSAVIGINQAGLAITKSQVTDFTSGTVTSASTAQQSGTAIYAVNSGTAVYSTTSGTALTITGSITKSQVSDFTSGTVTSASTAQQAGTATYATTSGTSVYATNSGTAVYATTSGTALTISGSITKAQVSDFTSGTVTSAGTAQQSGTAVYAETSGTAVSISGSITQSQVLDLVTDLAAKASTTDLTTGLALKANLAGGNAFTGANTFTGTATGSFVVVMRAASGQSTDILNVQRSNGSGAFSLGSGGGMTSAAGATFNNTVLGGGNALFATTIYPNTTPVAIRGAASQTANLLELQNSASSPIVFFTSGGRLVVGSDSSAMINATANATTTVPIVVAGASGQTANLQNWVNGGVIQASVGPFGNGTFGTTGTVYGRLSVNTGTTGTIGQVIRSVSGQTAAMWQLQNDAGNITANFTAPVNNVNRLNLGGTDLSATFGITVHASGGVGQVIRAAASQTANIQEWQDSFGSTRIAIDATGRIVSQSSANLGGFPSGLAVLGVRTSSATTLVSAIRGAANQVEDLVEWQSDSSTVLGGVNANAQIYTGSTAALTTSTGGATTATSGDGTTASVSTSSNHNLSVGDRVTIAGITPTGYNGTYVVTAIVSAFTFSYANATTGSQTIAGTVRVDAQTSIVARSAATVPLILRAATNQGVPMFRIEGSAGSSQATIDAGGVVTANGAYLSQLFAGAGISGGTIGRLNVSPFSAAQVGQVIRGVASQSGNYFEIQNSAASTQMYVDANLNIRAIGAIALGNLALGSGLISGQTTSASQIGAVIRGAASQTADLMQIQNSASTVLTKIDTGGYMGLQGGIFFLNARGAFEQAFGGAFLQMDKVTSTPTNPGASKGRMYFVDGTIPGTLKLVVRAGAAGAETTILDNIPQ